MHFLEFLFESSQSDRMKSFPIFYDLIIFICAVLFWINYGGPNSLISGQT